MQNDTSEPGDRIAYERAILVPTGMDGTSVRKALQVVHQSLNAIPADAFDEGEVSRTLAAQIQALQVSPEAFLSALNVAITGTTGDKQTQPSGIYEAMERLGKERTLRRIEHAIQQLMVVA